jgi:hypothetical protein
LVTSIVRGLPHLPGAAVLFACIHRRSKKGCSPKSVSSILDGEDLQTRYNRTRDETDALHAPAAEMHEMARG